MLRVIAKSYFHLVAAPICNDDAEPKTVKDFLTLVVGEAGYFGPVKRLKLREPGILVGKTFVAPSRNPKERKNKHDVTDPAFNGKGHWEFLYKVRVIGPPKDINLITRNLVAEYGPAFDRTTPARLKKLGWNPLDSKGIIICTNGKKVRV